MGEKLKECPFCGAVPAPWGTRWVFCPFQGCPGRGFLAEPGDWNRRAMPDVVRELLDAFVNPNIDEMGSGRCIRRQTEAVRAVREYYGEE